MESVMKTLSGSLLTLVQLKILTTINSENDLLQHSPHMSLQPCNICIF